MKMVTNRVGFSPRAEAKVLRATAYFMKRDLNNAGIEIKKALGLEPGNKSIALLSAQIGYYSALSSVAIPLEIPDWPIPIDAILVKRDTKSIELLRYAQNVFNNIISKEEETSDSLDILHTWYLASLANDPLQQDSAEALCRELLKRNPGNYRVIAWIIARGYKIDLGASALELEKLVSENTADIPHILALVNYYILAKKNDKAIELLNSKKMMFSRKDAALSWETLFIQNLIAKGLPEEAVSRIENSVFTTDLRSVKTTALLAISEKTDNWEPLVEHLEKSYSETKDPVIFFELLSFNAQLGQWEYVADRAEELIRLLDVNKSYELALISLYNANRYQECIDFIAKNPIYKEDAFHVLTRRMGANCKYKLGHLTEAIGDIEELARKEPWIGDLLFLSNLYIEKGDLEKLSILARDFNRISSEESIRIARIIQGKDRDLAKSFLKSAVEKGIPDANLAEAISVAHSLGVEDEHSSLLERASKLAERGEYGFRTGNLNDLIELIKAQREDSERVYKLYRTAEVPIHMIAVRFKISLAELYHNALSENELDPNPTRQPFLLTRHGNRGLIPGFPDEAPRWRIYLDTTSLLLCEHLRILEKLEKFYGPLVISAYSVESLLHMIGKARHPQPSRLATYNEIMALVDEQKIRIDGFSEREEAIKGDLKEVAVQMGDDWAKTFEYVRDKKAYFVVPLPLTNKDFTGPPTVLKKSDYERIINCRTILESLKEQGEIAGHEYKTALAALGKRDDPNVQTIPYPKSILVFAGSALEELSRIGVLAAVSKAFNVILQKDTYERIRFELSRQGVSRDLEQWLDSLRNRISKGIDKGIYQEIPRQDFDKIDDAMREAIGNEPGIGALLSFIEHNCREGDVLAIDDRAVNRFQNTKTAPIICINDILKALVAAKQLTVDEYYQAILRLRAGNVRFIPILKEEITYFLSQAIIKDDSLVETKELSILRRYVSGVLLDGELVLKPKDRIDGPQDIGEVGFVMGFFLGVLGAISDVWETDEEESLKKVRADWLLKNLFVDNLGLFSLINFAVPDQKESTLIANTLGVMILHALQLRSLPDTESFSERKSYLGWLNDKLLQKRFIINPEVLQDVVGQIKGFVLDFLKEKDDEITKRYAQIFYEDLPEILKGPIGRDADFMKEIGIVFKAVAGVGDLEFLQSDFLEMIAKVINGGKSTIKAVGSDLDIGFSFSKKEKNNYVISYTDPKDNAVKHISDSVFALFLESPTEREKALEDNRQWFDCPDTEFREAAKKIVSIPSLVERYETLEKWRNNSAEEFYRQLQTKLAGRHAFRLSELLPPSIESLHRHFRLSLSEKEKEHFRALIERSSESLLLEEGLESAAIRLFRFPVKTPKSIIEKLRRQPQEDRNAFIESLVRSEGSSLYKIHLLHLLCTFLDESPEYLLKAKEIVKWLLGENGMEDFEAFMAILCWVENEFFKPGNQNGGSDVIHLGLSWAHAERIYSIFISNGAPKKWLKNIFTTNTQRSTIDLFGQKNDLHNEITYPRLQSRDLFVLKGLLYALNGRTQDIVDEEIQALLSITLFTDSKGKRWPNLPLMKDYSLAIDSLGSFLSGDIYDEYNGLLKTDDIEGFKNMNPKVLLDYALSRLEKDQGELNDWMIIYMTLGELPPIEETARRLLDVFKRTHIRELFEKNIELGMMCIQAISVQLQNLKDKKLNAHVKGELLDIARYSWEKIQDRNTEKEVLEKIEEKIKLLPNLVLRTSSISDSTDECIDEFIDTMTEAVKICPTLIPLTKGIVELLIEEQPIMQAQKFWPLMIFLRSE
jgi:hypothetical protein